MKTSELPPSTGMTGAAASPPRHPAVVRVLRRVRRVFSRLDGIAFIGPEECVEFRRYQAIVEDSLAAIDRKIAAGRLRVLDLAGFPQVLRYPGYAARTGVFIGSFDPFQMTHLCTALRFLASPASSADFVIVVPEGAEAAGKPERTGYAFRYDLLRRQLEGIFEPFIVPLDIGAGRDTIGIVERLIALHPGARLELTHLLGSDALPTALRCLAEDLAAWGAQAERSGVQLDHGLFVSLRAAASPLGLLAEDAARQGLRIAFDPGIDIGGGVEGAPSSSDFRTRRAFTIVFPTDAVLGRLELLFRWRMNLPWAGAPPAEAGGGFSDCEI